MNSRYLWSGKDIVEGDENIIWGLLEDRKSLFPTTIKQKIPAAIPSPPSVIVPKLIPQEKAPRPTSKVNKSMRNYSYSMKKFNNSSITTPRISRPPSSRSMKPEVLRIDSFFITSDMKKSVLEWVEALGLDYQPNLNPYLDNVTNGLLVCELIKVLENENIRINPNPRSNQAVFDNFERALNVFKSKRPEIPNSVINKPESLIQSVELVFAFVYSLMSAYPTAAPLEYQPSLLPYGAIGIRKLERTIVSWIEGLNILHPSPLYFAELIPELKKGVLLCVVTSKVTNIKIYNIFPDPKTEQATINNIRKSLEILRKLPLMSQKFTWSEKEIIKGNYSVLLGLLEDILRWVDGLPVRKNGLEYHKDGPYLRTEHNLQKNETFNTTFGSSSSSKNIKQPNFDNEDIIAQWLIRTGIEIPHSLCFNDDHITEFTTGVLLCNIISRLEKIKIPGIEKDPENKKAALQNISKALSIVKKKTGFPKEIKQLAEEVFQGNGSVIRFLMQEIIKFYNSPE